MTVQNNATARIKADQGTEMSCRSTRPDRATGSLAIIKADDACLRDAKRDVAHVEPSSLTRHLAAHNRYRGRSHSQTLGGHRREQGSGRNLASS